MEKIVCILFFGFLCLVFVFLSHKFKIVSLFFLLISLFLFTWATLCYIDITRQLQLEDLAIEKEKAEIELLKMQTSSLQADIDLKKETLTWFQGVRYGLTLQTLFQLTPCVVSLFLILVVFGLFFYKKLI